MKEFANTIIKIIKPMTYVSLKWMVKMISVNEKILKMEFYLKQSFQIGLQEDFLGESECICVLSHFLNVADGQTNDQVHQDDHHLYDEEREEGQHPNPVLWC
jgi:hypothetical protein